MSQMASMRQRAAEGLQVGDTFTISRVFTDEEVVLFARISGDYNPVHFDARFARARNFPTTICHGLLTAGLVTEIGGQIGWLASVLNFKFKAPVYVGETITCRMVITGIDAGGRAKATATMTRDDGTVVIESELSGIVPGMEERRVLAEMLAEGDPTNGLMDARPPVPK